MKSVSGEPALAGEPVLNGPERLKIWGRRNKVLNPLEQMKIFENFYTCFELFSNK